MMKNGQKRILLGQAYFLRFDPKLWDAMRPYPPLGSLYAASYLREHGFGVSLFDAMLAESTRDWERKLRDERPDAAVLFEDSFNYLSKMCLSRMRQAAFEMIGAARAAGCPVVVAGSDASDRYQSYLDAGADAVLIGEGEASLLELLNSGFPDGLPNEPIDGVITRSHPTLAHSRPPMRDLDQMPFPAWDLVDMDRYRRIWRSRHGSFSMNMATTRGCPYHCNWCAKPIWGQRYFSRSPENVVEELAELKRRFEPDHIWFADDIFGLKKGWIERFSKLVCARRLQTPFKCLLRADLVDASRAQSLARAGCETVWIGAESGSQKILDAMEKGTKVEDTYRATTYLRREGIKVGYFIQFGYPGEDWSDIRRTMRMIWDNLPDDVGVSVSYPLPGTPFYERVKAELGAKQNWVDSDDLAPLYRAPYPQEFYRQLHTVLHREFRARKAWRRSKLQSPDSWRHMMRAVTLPFDRLKLRRLRSA